MPTLNIGGQRVKVDDSFLQMTPDQQNTTVEEIAKSLPAQAAPQPQQSAVDPSISAAADAYEKVRGTGAMAAATDAGATGIPFSDELYSAASALPNAAISAIKGKGFHPVEEYERSQALQAELTRRREEQHPVASTAGAIAGGMAAAGPLAKGGLSFLNGAKATLPSLVGRGLAEGTAYGSVYGAGEGGGLKERGYNAVKGAVSGGLTGGLLSGIVAGAPKAAGYLGDLAGGAFGIGNERRAQSALVTALERSGKIPEQIASELSQAGAEGQGGYMLADALGNPGQRMLSGVARSPGGMRQTIVDALEGRQAGQGRRIATSLDEAFKGEGTAAQNAEVVKDTARVVNAHPYAKAYDEGEKAIWSPELERIGSAPAVENAMKGALNIWRDTAIADGYGAMRPRALVDKGELKFQKGGLNVFPNLQFWDYTKRVLDDEIATAVRAGADSKVRTLTKLKKAMVSELDKAVPAYAKARSTAKGFFDIQDAIEAGKQAAGRGRTEDTTQLFNSLNPEQQQGFRTGYVDPLIERTQGAAHGVNKARPLINDATAVEFPAFAGQGGEKLQRQRGRENTMFETRNAALGGSRTADNLADQLDVGAIDPSLIGNLLTGRWGAAAGRLAGMGANALSGRNEAVRDAIAKALLGTAEQGAGRSFARTIGERGAAKQLRDARAKAIIEALTRGAGQQLPGYTAR